MNRRIFYLLLIILILAFLGRPSDTWQEMRRAWARRDWILKVLVTVISVYFLYGLFKLWARYGYPLP